MPLLWTGDQYRYQPEPQPIHQRTRLPVGSWALGLVVYAGGVLALAGLIVAIVALFSLFQ